MRDVQRILPDSSIHGGHDGTRGFLNCQPDSLRYSASVRTIWETTGMLCDRIPAGARVLDIGCGTGSISSMIARECQAVVSAVEPNAERAEAARSRGIAVTCGVYNEESAEALGEFDVIMFADVLEHVSDPVSLLELASKHLAAGGVILASIPNVAHWTVRVRLALGNFDYQPLGIMDATHLRWFTTRTVRRVFAAAGLRVTDHDWTSGSWMPEYSVLRFSERLRRLGLRRLVRAFPDLFGCQHIVTATAIRA